MTRSNLLINHDEQSIIVAIDIDGPDRLEVAGGLSFQQKFFS
jgi:hypothetical protein